MLCIPNQVNKYWKHERYLNVTATCVSLTCIYGGERDFGQQFTFIQGQEIIKKKIFLYHQ